MEAKLKLLTITNSGESGLSPSKNIEGVAQEKANPLAQIFTEFFKFGTRTGKQQMQ